MAYHHKNLNKVAQEFIMFDEMRRMERRPQENSIHTYQQPKEFIMFDEMRRMERRPQENPIHTYQQPKVIDAKQAAQRYGGVMEVTTGRPVFQQGGQAKQGGVWIMDYSKKKPKVMAF